MPAPDNTGTLTEVQSKSARLANEKLELEIVRLRAIPNGMSLFLQIIPGFSVALAMAGFAWGIFQYTQEQQKERVARARQSIRDQDNAERELMKPWIENQRVIYLEALTAAESAAAARAPKEQAEYAARFWRLYHDRMVLVETREVAGLMKRFGRGLDGADQCDQSTMYNRCHELASGMADSMAASAKMECSSPHPSGWHMLPQKLYSSPNVQGDLKCDQFSLTECNS